MHYVSSVVFSLSEEGTLKYWNFGGTFQGQDYILTPQSA